MRTRAQVPEAGAPDRRSDCCLSLEIARLTVCIRFFDLLREE